MGIPDNFHSYAGPYTDKLYGKAQIQTENGTAVLELLPSRKLFSGPLYFMNDSVAKIWFRDEFLPAGKIRFEQNGDTILGFTLDIPNDDFNFDNLHFSKMKGMGN
ncbi:MAG: hypothetical protein AAGA86_12820 [Bacteroidota bacterium]